MTHETEQLIRSEIEKARKRGLPTNHVLLLTDTTEVPVGWLSNTTVTPSGRTVGALRLGSAQQYLDELDHQRQQEDVA